jgi:hypothetical protein
LPQILLLKAGNHSTSSFRCQWEFSWTAYLWRVCGYVDQKNNPLWFLQYWFLGISQQTT